MKKSELKEKIESNFWAYVEEMPCPLCMGVGSTMSTHPSLSDQQFELSPNDPLECNAGHLLSVVGFNNKEIRPARKVV